MHLFIVFISKALHRQVTFLCCLRYLLFICSFFLLAATCVTLDDVYEIVYYTTSGNTNHFNVELRVRRFSDLYFCQ